MKKIILSLVSSLFLLSSANADFVRIEVGAGAWINQLDGTVTSPSSGTFNTDALGVDTQTKGYFWFNFKHPTPIIPNFRLEYVNLDFSGTATQSFRFKGVNYNLNTNSNINIEQYDIVAYYNLLDNTFWATFDIGLDVKVMNFDFTADSAGNKIAESESIYLPMLYSRVRLNIPNTDLGFEANAKYIGYDGNQLLDYSVKVDYTIQELLPVDIAVELGYRNQTFDVEGGGYSVDLTVSGLFAGIAIKF